MLWRLQCAKMTNSSFLLQMAYGEPTSYSTHPPVDILNISSPDPASTVLLMAVMLFNCAVSRAVHTGWLKASSDHCVCDGSCMPMLKLSSLL